MTVRSTDWSPLPAGPVEEYLCLQCVTFWAELLWIQFLVDMCVHALKYAACALTMLSLTMRTMQLMLTIVMMMVLKVVQDIRSIHLPNRPTNQPTNLGHQASSGSPPPGLLLQASKTNRETRREKQRERHRETNRARETWR